MKKQFVTLVSGLIFLSAIQSCHHRDTTISISESGPVCRMSASYPVNKTREVQRLLSEHLNEEEDDMSFTNTNIDGKITLDDRTTFYIKLYPGELKIKIDETENSEESYTKVREAFEDIKELLADDGDN